MQQAGSSTSGGAARAGGAGLVVVDRAWQSFEQLTAAAVRRGHPVRYVGVGLHRHSAALRGWAFPGTVTLPDLGGLEEVLRRAAEEGVAGAPVGDVLCNEIDLPEVLAAARRAGLPGPVLDTLAARLPFSDKVDASHLLTGGGRPVPRSLPGDADADAVTRELGWPCVVKGRRGAGGLAVAVVADGEELHRARRELRARTGDDVFVERFAPGRNVNYAAVHRDGRVLVECCFESVRRAPGEEHLPGDGLRLVVDPDVERIGREVVRRLPGVGIADVEVMTDGTDAVVVDVNLRPFGSMVALRDVGIDLPGAYLDALAGRPAPARPCTGAPGATASVFPTSSERLLAVSPAAGARDLAARLPGAVRVLGPRYTGVVTLGFGTRLARAVLDQARRRVGRVRRAAGGQPPNSRR